jgi:hypothetical protein
MDRQETRAQELVEAAATEAFVEPPLASWEVVDRIDSGIAAWPLASPEDLDAIRAQCIAVEWVCARGVRNSRPLL